jgi:hypothetical protein
VKRWKFGRETSGKNTRPVYLHFFCKPTRVDRSPNKSAHSRKQQTAKGGTIMMGKTSELAFVYRSLFPSENSTAGKHCRFELNVLNSGKLLNVLNVLKVMDVCGFL